jgi:hypothetical protein
VGERERHWFASTAANALHVTAALDPAMPLTDLLATVRPISLRFLAGRLCDMLRTADTDGGHVKKLLAIAGGSAAAAAIALVTAGPAVSDGPLDVSGEQYGKAVALLKAQGYKAVFGGSVGGDVPEAQCIVESQKVLGKGRISLMLNCTQAAQPPAQAAAAPPPGVVAGAPNANPGPPHVGANGITTVTATPVAPPPPAAPPPAAPGG